MLEYWSIGKNVFVVIVLLVALGGRSAAGETSGSVSLTGGGLRLTLDRNTARITSLTDWAGVRSEKLNCGLRFIEGRPQSVGAGVSASPVDLPLHVTEWRSGRGKQEWTGEVGDRNLTAQGILESSDEALRWRVRLKNSGTAPRLLEIRFVLPLLYGQREPWTFFDGGGEVLHPTTEVVRDRLGGFFPVTATCDERSGLAIAADATELHSWLSASVHPAQPREGFTFAVKRVVDPGAEEAVSFLTFSFDATWGPAAAVERHYDLFPEAFQTPPGTDERLYLAGGYSWGSPGTRPLQWEESRRLHHGWEPHWGFVRTGNWLPDEKHWVARAGDRKTFLEGLREQYGDSLPGCQVMHYLEVTQCEADLAEQEFADSILCSKAGPTSRFLLAVPVVSGEACHSMFPYANRFYRSTAAQVPEIIRQLRSPGLYIDNASGTGLHYGDLTGVPGRAFDADGAVYACTGLGTAALCDLAHRTRREDGKFAGVTCNGVGSFLVAAHTDATIQEGIPWERPGGVAAMRRLMGGKSVSWWEDHLFNYLRWRALSPPQIVEALRANVDYCLLYGLRWGVLPAVHVQRGRAALVRNMPLLVEVARAGWRPVAPVRADDRLWIGRFGTGLGLIITVSNPTRETLPARLEVDTRTLGLAGGVFAFHEKSPPGGVPLRNEIAAGDTRLSFDLQPKEFRVLRAVAAFGPLATGAVVLAQEGRDDYGRLVTTCTIEQAHLPLTDARLWLPKESSLEVTVRSQARNEVECRSGKGEVRVQCRLKPQAQIVARAEGPVRLTSTVEELCTFPFLIDNKPAAAIVLPANATPEEKTAATRLSVYFEYYLGRQADLLAGPGSLKNPALELPMVSDAALAPAGASLIAVGTPTDHPLVAAWVRSQVRNEVEYRPRRHAATASWLTTNQALGKDGVRGVISLGQTGRREERHGVRSLLVVAAEPAAVDEAMLQLLSVLDGKYPSTWGLFRSDATEKAGLAGKDFTGGEKPEVTTPSSPEETGPITLPADNLLQNAGFEEGNPSPTGWAFSSPNASEHQCEFSTDAREGQRAVYVPRGQYWQQTVELKPLAWYRYRVWRQLGANSTFLLWWCGLLEDGSERGGERLYEQCQPNLDLIPNFLPADYFSQPDVWNLTEMTFRAPGYPRYSIRLGGWGKVLVDAAVLEPAAGP